MDTRRALLTLVLYANWAISAHPVNTTQESSQVLPQNRTDIDTEYQLEGYNFSSNANETIELSNNEEPVGAEPLRTTPCPVGFIRHRNSCYHIIGSSELTWPIANTYCQLHGSKLVEIETESEQRFLSSLIRANRDGEAFWIGATNRRGQGDWRWESDDEPLSYSLWVTDWTEWVHEVESPSCALIDKTERNQWMFWPCGKNFFLTGRRRSTQTGIGFICEKESPRPPRPNRQNRNKRRRRLRRKNRRNWQQTRHWRRFLQ